MVLIFQSVDKILKCDYSNQNDFQLKIFPLFEFGALIDRKEVIKLLTKGFKKLVNSWVVLPRKGTPVRQ